MRDIKKRCVDCDVTNNMLILDSLSSYAALSFMIQRKKVNEKQV
jgi:hypothetical protein